MTNQLHRFILRISAGLCQNLIRISFQAGRSAALVMIAASFAVLTALPMAAQAAASMSCTFASSTTECGFGEQSFVPGRATLVNYGRDGSTAVRLHTEPGDNYVAGSGINERDDLSLSQSATGCYQGNEQWWAHSILFPDDYVAPPVPTPFNWTWGVVFDFHGTGSGPQANFQINAMSDGLAFQIYGGDPAAPVSYQAPIGPVTKNIWYDFVYHIKWSSGSDGYFDAWVNGVQKMAYTGPTIYLNEGCYLKLANYHSPFGLATSVVHDRIISGATQADITGSQPPAPPTSSPPATTSKRAVRYDFDGDGKSDILWRNNSNGQNQIWLMNGPAISSAPSINPVTDSNWKIAGSGDFDGDGKSDILWRNGSTGQNAIWFMNGATLNSGPFLATVTDQNWQIAGVGDFDGDGKSDILWRNGSTGQNQIWFMNGATLSSGLNIVTVSDQNWQVAKVGDFDGDGKSDILWRNGSTGQNQIWFMNGATLSSGPNIATVSDQNWQVAGVGDFDGDGKSDILWRNGSTGQNQIWLMNGATLANSGDVYTVTDFNWNIVGIGDFNGDGKADVVWRNRTTGQNAMFVMNGLTLVNLAYLNTVSDNTWQIALK